jgi:hypothetical protein
MATDIVQSLFGVTPEMYQQRQAAAADERALALAQLNPMQRAEFNIGRGAYQLAGALGGTDPQLQMISARNALAKQIDFNDPASIQAGVQSLAQAGDTMGAMMLADTARKAKSEIALAQQRSAEKMTPEQRNALAYAASMGEPGSEQFKLAYQAKLEQLTSKEGQGKTPEQRNAEAFAATKGSVGTPEYATAFQAKFEELIAKKPTANIREVGVAENTRKPVYLDVNSNEQFVFGTDAQGKQVRQPYVGGVDRTTAKVSASVTSKGETKFTEKLAELDAKRVDEALTLRENATAALNTFNALSKLDDQGLISGTFATGRVGATNLLNTLGLIGDTDVGKLARSENYQKIAGDAILATLGGKLGAGFSNEDRKFIQGLVPQLENSPAARRQLIDFMLRKNQAIVNETTRLETYARDKLGLKGYVPSIPLPKTTPTSGGALSGLTDEELKRRYNEAQGKK